MRPARRRESRGRAVAPAAPRTRVEVVREPKPRRKPKQEDVLDGQHTGVAYSARRSVYQGPDRILQNPDPVLARVGGHLGPAFYEEMLLRHPWLAGIVDQRVEKANRPRVIVPGDPSDDRSVMMADLARRKWQKVQSATTALASGLRNGRFIGPGGLEKVFTRDADGIVYVCRLINRPPRNIKFRADGTALWISANNPIHGEVIPRRKMMFIQGGSLNSPYPEVELSAVYAATYLIEKAVELMLDTVEEFGRPIPTVYMPRAKSALSKEERTQIRAYARAVHSRFCEVPTNETDAHIDMGGNASMAASGAAGRPEAAIVEMMMTWSYIRILRITQTLNKTGSANGMLEQVRYQITDDASRPDCILIDDSLNMTETVGDEYTGWMADFNDFNFPDEPVELLARFETPTLSQEEIQQIHDRTMDAIDRGLGETLSEDAYLRTTGMEKAKNEDDRLGGRALTRLTQVEVLEEESNAADANDEDAIASMGLRGLAAMAGTLNRRLDAMVGL